VQRRSGLTALEVIIATLLSSESLLSSVESYGLPAFALALLLGAIGIPLPCTMLLVAIGALIRIGLFEWHVVVLLALVVTVVGDTTGYLVGRWAVGVKAGWFVRRAQWEPAREGFERWGGVMIVLTRFLLTPLALATNLVAGSTHYGLRRFLLFNTAGELVWVVTYVGLGFVFADRWEAVLAVMGEVAVPGGLIAGALLIAVRGLPALLPRRMWANDAGSVMRGAALRGD
jgi:membrane-associated protein